MGGAFVSLFCPEGRVFVHNDGPRGGFLLSSSRVPGGWLWMQLIPALTEYFLEPNKVLKLVHTCTQIQFHLTMTLFHAQEIDWLA